MKLLHKFSFFSSIDSDSDSVAPSPAKTQPKQAPAAKSQPAKSQPAKKAPSHDLFGSPDSDDNDDLFSNGPSQAKGQWEEFMMTQKYYFVWFWRGNFVPTLQRLLESNNYCLNQMVL